MNFKVGQKVVYPNHGIGTIEHIEQKQIGAATQNFYLLKLAVTKSLVIIPVANAAQVGLRAPIKSGECQTLLKALGDDFLAPPTDWKDRFKIFSEKMNTGDVFEVALVLKMLSYLHHIKPLSFREQRMLERARYLVTSELAIVCRETENEITRRIEESLIAAYRKHERKAAKVRVAAATVGH